MPVTELRQPHKLTCIEAFSGAGGMALGLGQAGYDVRLAFDNNETAASTYNLNLGPHCRVLDARKASARGLLSEAGLKVVDPFRGGPPCKGFSKQRRGAHRFDDPRNSL